MKYYLLLQDLFYFKHALTLCVFERVGISDDKPQKKNIWISHSKGSVKIYFFKHEINLILLIGVQKVVAKSY